MSSRNTWRLFTYLQVPSRVRFKSSSSSGAWLTRQARDEYVKKARDCDYRARSAFKLLEIDSKLRLLHPGQVVVECGCSPGAWSQVVMEKIGVTGYLIGIDLLPTAPIPGATFLNFSDFTHEDTRAKLRRLLEERQKAHPDSETRCVDLVLSDMAPNLSGVSSLDQARAMTLVESVIAFAAEEARPGSSAVMKVFGDPSPVRETLASLYKNSKIVKPKSSRSESSEIYVAGIGLIR